MRRGRFKKSLEENVVIRRSDGVRINAQGVQIPNIIVVGDRFIAIVEPTRQAYANNEGLIVQSFGFEVFVTPPVTDVRTHDQIVRLKYLDAHATDTDIINHSGGGVLRVVNADPPVRQGQVFVCDEPNDPFNFS